MPSSSHVLPMLTHSWICGLNSAPCKPFMLAIPVNTEKVKIPHYYNSIVLAPFCNLWFPNFLRSYLNTVYALRVTQFQLPSPAMCLLFFLNKHSIFSKVPILYSVPRVLIDYLELSTIFCLGPAWYSPESEVWLPLPLCIPLCPIWNFHSLEY